MRQMWILLHIVKGTEPGDSAVRQWDGGTQELKSMREEQQSAQRIPEGTDDACADQVLSTFLKMKKQRTWQ